MSVRASLRLRVESLCDNGVDSDFCGGAGVVWVSEL
jgi:hypothetical protein